MKILTVLLLLLVAPLVLAEEACWSHYKKTTIPEHISAYPVAELNKWTHYQQKKDEKLRYAVIFSEVTAEGSAVSVPVHYSGEFRPITTLSKEALFSFGGKNVTGLFSQELKVREGDFDGWILMQDVLVQPLDKEVSKDGVFTACLQLIGVLGDKHLYIMNEFGAK